MDLEAPSRPSVLATAEVMWPARRETGVSDRRLYEMHSGHWPGPSGGAATGICEDRIEALIDCPRS
jgi:hypothetical protein